MPPELHGGVSGKRRVLKITVVAVILLSETTSGRDA
jgi:hypothetical protein